MTQEASSSSSRGDFTNLADRLSLLLVVRLGMAAVVLITSFVLPSLGLDEKAITVAQAYIGISVFVELLHRYFTKRRRRRGLLFVNVMLLVDGAFVAAILAYSGDARSTFIVLAYAHIVSVTLLVGFRTGLKMALWQSMLLLTVYYLGLANVIPEANADIAGGNHKLGQQLEVAQAIALWVVAICTAVFGSLNERELRRRKGELTIVADLSAEIEQTRRPSEILQALVDASIDRLQAEQAVAFTAHAGSVIVAGGHEGATAIHTESLTSLGGVVEKAFHSQKPVLVKALSPQDEPRVCEYLPGASNISAIPMIAEGECVGVLVASWGNHKRRITQPVIDLMSNIAGRVALSLSNTFLLAEVQRLASVDGLTGLPNRRTFNQAIERELARARRNSQPVSLLMLDIDHFKSVNDNHGHQMGDTVLAESAAGVMEACRGEDLPARYGGEEIVVIMPNCSVEEAFAAGDRIRRALGDANQTLPGTHASGGIATFPNHADDVVGLLAAADEALYFSKENGRDRCTLSTRTNPQVSLGSEAHSS